MAERLKNGDDFIKAYREFKDQVDLNTGGTLPELDDLVCYMLMGVPRVPADRDSGEEAPMVAVEQRINILKAVFVEINRERAEDFIDEGLRRYDQAARMVKLFLEEGKS